MALNTINGTEGNDQLGPTPSDDLINGFGGDDALNGGQGSDTIYGGDGNDLVNGGLGNDVLDGGAGFDRAAYSGLPGGVTVDLNVQGPQNTGAGGVDTLVGFENLSGGNGNDVLTGDGGSNWLWGQGGADTMSGNGGDDLIQDVQGDNIMDGGAGIDTASFNNNGDATLLNVSVSLAAQGAPQATGHGSMTLTGFENLSGGDGADTLTGDDGANLLAGSAGGDSLVGGDGDDTLLGDGIVGLDTGNVGTSGPIAVFDDSDGQAGADTLVGGNGADTLVGGDGDDVLSGGAGNDVFLISGGHNVITDFTVGQDLFDLSIYGFDTFAHMAPYLSEVGGSAVLTITYGGAAHTATFQGVSLASLSGNEFIFASGPKDFDGTDDSDLLPGTGGADTLNGYGGNDTLLGLSGDDVMKGGTGDDIFSVDSFGDVVIENPGEGTDTIQTTLSSFNLASVPNVENLTFVGTGNFVARGNGGNNVVAGSDGSDDLRGNGGNDTIHGGGGNDFIYGNAGDDLIDGGAGYDRAGFFSGATAGVTVDLNLQGTAQNTGQGMDTLVNIEHVSGTPFSDVLTGDNGDNVLAGQGGADTLSGGGGDDLIVSADGGSVLDGGVGIDTLSLNSNGDATFFNMAVSLAAQGAPQATGHGSMTLTGFENLSGGDGDDSLTGDANANLLAGGFGGDSLVGGGGSDTLLGDGVVAMDTGGFGLSGPITTYTDAAVTFAQPGGNDTLDGGAGADTMTGGLGDDTYVVDDAGDKVVELAGQGVDTVQTTLTNFSIASTPNVENLSFTGAGNFTGTGDANANVLTGGGGADNLNGAAGADTMAGGAGNDIYVVDNVGDVVSEQPGQGIDTIRTDLSSYSLAATPDVETLVFSGAGAFTGTGNAANNTLQGGGGSDLLDGGDGDDQINGGGGNNTLTGGAGDDTISHGGGNDLIDGGDGNDVLNDSPNAGNDTFSGGAGDDLFLVRNFNNQPEGTFAGSQFNGGDGTDYLAIGSHVNFQGSFSSIEGIAFLTPGGTISPGFLEIGASQMHALSPSANFRGAGQVRVTLDAEHVFNGSGYTFDPTSSVAFIVDGTSGTDTVTGTSNGDVIHGFDGDGPSTGGDSLGGGGGADTIQGSGGDDTIAGGAGGDVFRISIGHDVITDFVHGQDKFDLSGYGFDSFASLQPYLSEVGGSAVLTGVYNGVQITHTFQGVSLATLDAGDFIVAGAVSPDIPGTDNADLLPGSSGADTLSGAGGNDTLIGFGGADSLSGGSGADKIDGGAGDDTMAGGAGDDTFVVDSAGDVVSENPGDGTDLVQTAIGSYTLTSDVENLTYTGAGSFAGTGNGAGNVLTGGAGNDTLDGAGGADTMIGGAGNDTFAVDVAGDVVTEAAGAGTDTIRTTLATFSLGALANIENLTFAGGVGGFSGTGNGAANVLTGGSGNDTLDGGAGNDTMVGGSGDDSFVVSSSGDVVTEAALGGTDTILASSNNYSLAPLANVENLTYTGSGNFTGVGNGAGNVLISAGGNDNLDGGAGADTMTGAGGNDTYVVDNAGDVVNETTSGGTDTIQTTLASFSLASVANVENLTFTGSGSFSGLGNGSANVLTGGAGADTLDGGAGADTMNGGAGNDTYLVDNAGDSISESNSGGVDTVQTALTTFSLASLSNVENLTFTGAGNFTGTGDTGDNVLTGGAGNDVLDGAKGNDTMVGGAGDDTYLADSLQDSIVEQSNGGIDTVKTSLAGFTLAANVENLFYTGTKDFSGVGNAGANLLTSGAGDDTLAGGAGVDTMAAGTGDDTYVVDDLGDVVNEAAGAGTDTIRTTLGSYSLAGAANVENLAFTGSGGFAGTGNGLGNVITGGAGGDTLDGGAGNDTLTGGAGADMFRFDTLPNASTNVDRITDFTHGSDKIVLDHTIFDKLGAVGQLDTALLHAGNNFTTALGDHDFLIYNSKNGFLYYDADANGAGAAVQIAVITGSPTLTSLDFVVG